MSPWPACLLRAVFGLALTHRMPIHMSLAFSTCVVISSLLMAVRRRMQRGYWVPSDAAFEWLAHEP